MQGNVIYHIGLPKTGTTFLRDHYFPNLQGDFVYLCDIKYRREWGDFTAGLTDRVKTVAPELAATTLLYSSGRIANLWLRVNKYLPPWSMHDVADRVLKFHELKFGKRRVPHILIGFRDFDTWIMSYYAEHAGIADLDELLSYVERNPQIYSWALTEKLFRDRFDSVFIYRQEEILHNLSSINNWFRHFNLDGSNISSMPLNKRKIKPNQYSKVYLPDGCFAKFYHLYGSKLPAAYWHRLYSWVQSRYRMDVVVSDAQLQRAREIGEYVQSWGQHSE